MAELNRSRHDDDPVTIGRTTAVVLGDSYAQGLGLPDPRAQSWPALVGKDRDWTTYVNAVGATGFVNGGFCGNEQFAARLEAVLGRQPQIVVVQGGLNDSYLDATTVGAAAGALLDRLGEVPTVIVVGPTVPSAGRAQPIGQLDAALRIVTAAHHRRYVSALSWAFSYQSDHIHPTVDGHRDYAAQLEAVLKG